MRSHEAKAAPFPIALLGPLVHAAASLGSWSLPFRALVLVAFFTFARLSSLVPPAGLNFDASRWPTLADIRFQGEWAYLQIKYSKTRQAADGGREVPFRTSRSFPCPVFITRELHTQRVGAGLPPSSPLFAVTADSGRRSLPLTQSRARVFLKSCLGQMGLPPRAYSFHSFRRGGCSLAFSRGATESDLALHGDWRSAAIRQYYPAATARRRVASFMAAPPN